LQLTALFRATFAQPLIFYSLPPGPISQPEKHSFVTVFDLPITFRVVTLEIAELIVCDYQSHHNLLW